MNRSSAQVTSLFNTKTLEFLGDIFNGGGDDEDWLVEYIRYWSNDTDKKVFDGERCTLCALQISSSTSREAFLRNIYMLVNQFAKRLPLTTLGLVYTWYTLARKMGMSRDTAVTLLDPISIYFHFNVGCCASVIKKDVRDVLRNIAWFKRERRLGNVYTFVETKKVASAYMETDRCDDADDVVVDDDEVVDDAPADVGTSKQRVKVTFLNTFVSDLTTTPNTCVGTDPLVGERDCVYASFGDLETVMGNKTMPVDGRTLVSRNWFEENMGEYFPYEMYLSDDLYALGQLGVSVADYSCEREGKFKTIFTSKTNVERAVAMMDYKDLVKEEKPRSVEDYITSGKGDVIQSLFSFVTETEMKDTNVVVAVEECVSREEKERLIDAKIRERWDNILGKVARTANLFQRIIRVVENKGRLRECGDMFPQCLWCDLAVIPEVRVAMMELLHTARKRIMLVSTVRESGMKNCHSLIYHRMLPVKRLRSGRTFLDEELPGGRTRSRGASGVERGPQSRNIKGMLSGARLLGGLKRMTPKQVMGIFNEGLNNYDTNLLGEIGKHVVTETDVLTYGITTCIPLHTMRWRGCTTIYVKANYRLCTRP